MKRLLLPFFLLAQAALAEPVREVVYFEGKRAGSMETRSFPIEGGKKARSESELELTLHRFGATVKVRRLEAVTEGPGGAVLTTYMQQGQVGGKQMALAGVVDGPWLRVRTVGESHERRVPWREDVLGPMRQLELFTSRKPKPGDRLQLRRYEPTYNAVLTVQVEVKEREAVTLGGKPRQLLRVDLTPEALTAGARKVTPPGATWWLDDKGAVARRRTTLEGLGELVLERTDRPAGALPPIEAADIGKASLVPLDRPVLGAYGTRSARYRICPRAGESAEGLFPSDAHQTVKGDILAVHPSQKPGSEKAEEAHRASNKMIDSADARVAELAKRAVGSEASAWGKAVRIERWVKEALTNDTSAEMAPASVTARTRRGDCRHHAFLCAAMCRAAGVPARTAIGLVYVNRGKPAMGFHMWAEVLVDGAWRGIDSTLGRGGVSAGHIKVTDHTWAGVESLEPFLPVQAVLGKVRLEVLEAR
jgi:transglutaminase-like putative cysteine protease